MEISQNNVEDQTTEQCQVDMLIQVLLKKHMTNKVEFFNNILSSKKENMLDVLKT